MNKLEVGQTIHIIEYKYGELKYIPATVKKVTEKLIYLISGKAGFTSQYKKSSVNAILEDIDVPNEIKYARRQNLQEYTLITDDKLEKALTHLNTVFVRSKNEHIERITKQRHQGSEMLANLYQELHQGGSDEH